MDESEEYDEKMDKTKIKLHKLSKVWERVT